MDLHLKSTKFNEKESALVYQNLKIDQDKNEFRFKVFIYSILLMLFINSSFTLAEYFVNENEENQLNESFKKSARAIYYTCFAILFLAQITAIGLTIYVSLGLICLLRP